MGIFDDIVDSATHAAEQARLAAAEAERRARWEAEQARAAAAEAERRAKWEAEQAQAKAAAAAAEAERRMQREAEQAQAKADAAAAEAERQAALKANQLQHEAEAATEKVGREAMKIGPVRALVNEFAGSEAVQETRHAIDEASHTVRDPRDVARMGFLMAAQRASRVEDAVAGVGDTVAFGVETAVASTKGFILSTEELAEQLSKQAVALTKEQLAEKSAMVESAFEGALHAYEDATAELQKIAREFIQTFQNLAAFEKSMAIKEVLDALIEYGWNQLERAAETILQLGPTMLSEASRNPIYNQVEAFLQGLQHQVDHVLGLGEDVVGPLRDSNAAMQLLQQLISQGTHIFEALQGELLGLLEGLGLNPGPVDELVRIVRPLIELAVGVISSEPLALNLKDAFHTIMHAVGELGEWLREHVVSGLVVQVKALIQKVRQLFQGEAYVPGLSELYGMVHLGLGGAPKLSVQTAVTSAIAYFVNVSYSVATGRELDVPKDELVGWISGLPSFPSADEVLDLFSQVTQHIATGGRAAAPSIGRLLGGERVPPLPKTAAFAADMILSHVEFVAILLGGGETIALTVIGGVLNGTCSALRSLMRAADILIHGDSYSPPRIAMESSLAYLQYTGLGRSLMMSLAKARETKELSKLSVGIIGLADLLLSGIEQGVRIALETLKLAEGSSSKEQFTVGVSAAHTALVTTMMSTISGVVQISNDPLVQGETAAVAGAATVGVGAAAVPVAAQSTRALDVLNKAGLGIKVYRKYALIQVSSIQFGRSLA